MCGTPGTTGNLDPRAQAQATAARVLQDAGQSPGWLPRNVTGPAARATMAGGMGGSDRVPPSIPDTGTLVQQALQNVGPAIMAMNGTAGLPGVRGGTPPAPLAALPMPPMAAPSAVDESMFPPGPTPGGLNPLAAMQAGALALQSLRRAPMSAPPPAGPANYAPSAVDESMFPPSPTPGFGGPLLRTLPATGRETGVAQPMPARPLPPGVDPRSLMLPMPNIPAPNELLVNQLPMPSAPNIPLPPTRPGAAPAPRPPMQLVPLPPTRPGAPPLPPTRPGASIVPGQSFVPNDPMSTFMRDVDMLRREQGLPLMFANGG